MAKVYKRKGKYRVCEATGNKHIAMTKKRKSLDGGGHESRAKAERQAGYINGEKKNGNQ